MARRKARNGRTELPVVKASSLTLVKGAAMQVIDTARSALELVQRVRSTVRSVQLIAEPVTVRYVPEPVAPGPLLLVPLGSQDLALRSRSDVDTTENVVTLSLDIDAYLLDRSALRARGTLISQATCRFSTQLRVVLRETIDVPPDPASVLRRKRLKQASSTV